MFKLTIVGILLSLSACSFQVPNTVASEPKSSVKVLAENIMEGMHAPGINQVLHNTTISVGNYKPNETHTFEYEVALAGKYTKDSEAKVMNFFLQGSGVLLVKGNNANTGSCEDAIGFGSGCNVQKVTFSTTLHQPEETLVVVGDTSLIRMGTTDDFVYVKSQLKAIDGIAVDRPILSTAF